MRRREVSLGLVELARSLPLTSGAWSVLHVSATRNENIPILRFTIDVPVEKDQCGVPVIDTLGEGADRQRVVHAIIRAGARHPGVRLATLAELHRQAHRESHVELFADLCAITTGLLQTVVRSLGEGVARVVVSSSSVDVMAEYQGGVQRKGREAFLRQAEMRRALALLDELRRHVPVHVHQLAPGAARYFRRTSADGPGIARDEERETAEARDEPWTYVSEDRQMMAAYWHYLSTDNPRIPVRFVTADHHLARVCAAEKVPLLFGRDSATVLGDHPEHLELLWFDPFALRLRSVAAQELLWELALIYGTLHVQNGTVAYRLRRADDGWPGEVASVSASEAEVVAEPDPKKPAQKNPPESVGKAPKSAPESTGRAPDKGTPPKGRLIKLAFTSILKVLPTRPEQSIPLETFPAKDEDLRRQLAHVGEATGLFTVDDTQVTSGVALPELLEALDAKDYVRINEIFRRVPWYDQALADADAHGFGRETGAAGGWAVVLGAAYKSGRGLRYGLAPLSDEAFEDAVVDAHATVGRGGQTAPLAQVMERVCENQRVSPVRFEAMLGRALGHGKLSNYEAQRASHDERERFPEQMVLVKPTTSNPDSYIRKMNPGAGLLIGGKSYRSLVRRDGGAR